MPQSPRLSWLPRSRRCGNPSSVRERKARAFKEQLTEALEQQTATAEILRVISTSPTDLQPVLDVMARSGARFCGADDEEIFHLHGDSLKVAAHHGRAGRPARAAGTAQALLLPALGRAHRGGGRGRSPRDPPTGGDGVLSRPPRL